MKSRFPRELVRAVKNHVRAAQIDIAPALSRRTEPEFQLPEIQFVQAAQNTLRTCLEAVLQEATPYSVVTLGELAIRLASYAVSAAPLEDQDELLATVVQALPAAHSKRLANGIIIQADWNTNSVEHPNIPGGRA